MIHNDPIPGFTGEILGTVFPFSIIVLGRSSGGQLIYTIPLGCYYSTVYREFEFMRVAF